ncbi:hypothetical protein SAMN04488539_0310 [Corynebacterium timonense]|uniref:MerR HTH family regulatory protein n=1 Tax=Corynebacterium timonense TaxID=441500 RepID=A0A1H1LSW8_9CORY|nr:hypothetical protein SAMN04488539_0310 [Corynebacterium timonense]
MGVDYIAERTGYTTAAIRHWDRAGKLPPVAPPRRKEWFKGDIDKWITDNFEFGDA